jgi:3'-phosphoadenosine 5'-phosphosulfate sulfotransferase (PAPS reductase)/FAD synthetase
MNNKLKQLQSLPLNAKITLTENRIREFYDKMNGNIYVAFSGGKDSTVLLDLVRSCYSKTPAVFVNTGLEYPDVVDFVRTVENVIWLKPKINFKEVINKYGYPIISKQQSQYIYQYRNAKSEKTKELRLNGINGNYKISEKWKFLLDTNIKISDKCCDIMKKEPFKIFNKTSKLFPIVGTMACESNQRELLYNQYGCNNFKAKTPISKPISVWLEQDIWDYIKLKKISYASIYDKGWDRTGCMFCMFGVHLEKGQNRFERMKDFYPKQYDFCMNNLNIKDILRTILKKYENEEN